MAKQKVAVLGGGLGAMSAVYGLTTCPGWEERYDITVYQLGWRLGGKGASGRNMDKAARIEEHGLHIWFGFYDNAFKMMIDAYDDCLRDGLTPDSPFKTVHDAFKPLNMVTVMEQIDDDHQGKKWAPWTVDFPTNDEPIGSSNLDWTPWTLFVDLFDWIVRAFEDLLSRPKLKKVNKQVGFFGKLEGWVEGAVRDVESTFLTGAAAATESFLHLAVRLLKKMGANPNEHSHHSYNAILWLLDKFIDGIRFLLRKQLKENTDLRRFFITIDISFAVFRGAVSEGVFQNGWDVADKYDFREFLKKYGCDSYDTAPVKAAYDLVFAYEGGDGNRPNLAAGICSRAFSRILLTYKGSILWKMQAGMGDTVFSPVYLALKHKGVKFEFFNRVTNLALSQDRQNVDTIHIDVQGTIKKKFIKENGGYQPLVYVKGIPCWPSTPLYEQIKQGEEWRTKGINPESFWCPPCAEKKELQRGKDFDIVLLGISLGALKHMAKELIDHNERWQEMTENVLTVQTQAYQLWFNEKTKDMGWDPWYPKTTDPIEKTVEQALAGAYVEPLDTWAEMTQLIPREQWSDKDNVQSIAYFCGSMKDPQIIPPPTECDFPDEQHAVVKKNARRMLLHDCEPLWPDATQKNNPGALDWDVLVDSDGGAGEARLDYQFYRANVEPTERYVLSVKDSTKYRMLPGESGYANVYMAGDWTYNGLNVGCVEAAVMSGLGAAQAICGSPKHIVGQRDFHVQRPPTYVRCGGEQAFPGPFEFTNATMHLFAFASKYDALQRLCDVWFNKPTMGAVDYRPLLPYFFVCIADFSKLMVNPGTDRAFDSPEVDINLAFPVVKLRGKGGIKVAERLAWFFPYLFVDNTWAVASGRESYGFLKEFSQLELPRAAADNAVFSVDTQVVQKYGPNAHSESARVLEIKRTDKNERGDPKKAVTSLETVAENLFVPLLTDGREITLPGIGLIKEAWDFLIKSEIPLVFLKQFPEVGDRDDCCYQSMVEAPMKIKRITSAGALPGKYQITASEFASHPIVVDMGMQSATQDCLAAVTVTGDMVLELGEQVWP